MLIMTTPGGIHEKLFSEIGQSIDEPPFEPDIPKTVQIGEKYGIIIPSPGAW